MSQAPRLPSSLRLLGHPIVVACLACWALNDHVLKAAFHNEWTGKLSDIACLVVVPVLLPAAWEAITGRRHRHAVVYGALVGAAVMVTINLFEPAARAYEIGLGVAQWPTRAIASMMQAGGLPSLREVVLTRDPSDAWTVFAVLVPIGLSHRSMTGAEHCQSNGPR